MTTSIDHGRLRRGLALDVQPTEGGWLVTGGSEPHIVRGKSCDCADAQFHRGPCKHRAAVYLHRQLDERVRRGLVEALT